MNAISINEATRPQLIEIVKQLRQQLMEAKAAAVAARPAEVKELQDQISGFQGLLQEKNDEIQAIRMQSRMLSEKSANDESTISTLFRRIEELQGADPQLGSQATSPNLSANTTTGRRVSVSMLPDASGLHSVTGRTTASSGGGGGASNNTLLASLNKQLSSSAATVASKNDTIVQLESKLRELMEVNSFYAAIVSQHDREEMERMSAAGARREEKRAQRKKQQQLQASHNGEYPSHQRGKGVDVKDDDNDGDDYLDTAGLMKRVALLEDQRDKLQRVLRQVERERAAAVREGRELEERSERLAAEMTELERRSRARQPPGRSSGRGSGSPGSSSVSPRSRAGSERRLGGLGASGNPLATAAQLRRLRPVTASGREEGEAEAELARRVALYERYFAETEALVAGHQRSRDESDRARASLVLSLHEQLERQRTEIHQLLRRCAGTEGALAETTEVATETAAVERRETGVSPLVDSLPPPDSARADELGREHAGDDDENDNDDRDPSAPEDTARSPVAASWEEAARGEDEDAGGITAAAASAPERLEAEEQQQQQQQQQLSLVHQEELARLRLQLALVTDRADCYAAATAAVVPAAATCEAPQVRPAPTSPPLASSEDAVQDGCLATAAAAGGDALEEAQVVSLVAGLRDSRLAAALDTLLHMYGESLGALAASVNASAAAGGDGEGGQPEREAEEELSGLLATLREAADVRAMRTAAIPTPAADGPASVLDSLFSGAPAAAAAGVVVVDTPYPPAAPEPESGPACPDTGSPADEEEVDDPGDYSDRPPPVEKPWGPLESQPSSRSPCPSPSSSSTDDEAETGPVDAAHTDVAMSEPDVVAEAEDPDEKGSDRSFPDAALTTNSIGGAPSAVLDEVAQLGDALGGLGVTLQLYDDPSDGSSGEGEEDAEDDGREAQDGGTSVEDEELLRQLESAFEREGAHAVTTTTTTTTISAAVVPATDLARYDSELELSPEGAVEKSNSNSNISSHDSDGNASSTSYSSSDDSSDSDTVTGGAQDNSDGSVEERRKASAAHAPRDERHGDYQDDASDASSASSHETDAYSRHHDNSIHRHGTPNSGVLGPSTMLSSTGEFPESGLHSADSSTVSAAVIMRRINTAEGFDGPADSLASYAYGDGRAVGVAPAAVPISQTGVLRHEDPHRPATAPAPAAGAAAVANIGVTESDSTSNDDSDEGIAFQADFNPFA